MAQFETWQRVDLKKPLNVQQIQGVMFSADNQANLFGVEVLDGGEPAALVGTVTAYVMRADGVTLLATGSLSGNRVTAILPASSYAIPGPVDVVIRLVTGSGYTAVKTVLGAWHGYIQRSTTDAIYDPTGEIPDLTELLAVIDQAEAAADAIAAYSVTTQLISGENYRLIVSTQ